MSDFLYTVIIYPLIQLIQLSFTFVYRFCKNPGISVIGVSLAVTIFCLPLYIVAEKWQDIQRKTEAKLKFRTDRIKAAFKGDEQYMILTTYYRQNGYHPLMALRSSFGLLIQVPFFMAAYTYLSNLGMLKGESFLFIRDMGAQDALFTIGSFPVNVLPVAMTLINIIAGAIYTKGFALREKIQIYGMAVIFLVILYSSPSGLVLYWTMNNVFSLIKNIFYKLKNPVKALYGILLVFIAAMDIFLIFFFSKSPRILPLKLVAIAFFTALAFIPLYVKAVDFALEKVFSKLMEDSKLRLTAFLFCAVSLALYFGAILPSLLITSSVQEFADLGTHSNPAFFVFNTLKQTIGLFIFWPACIYFLFGNKIKTIMTLVFGYLLVCSLVNTFAFPGAYGTMNQWLVFTANVSFGSLKQTALNIACLCLTISLLTLIINRKAAIIQQLYATAAIAFTVFTVVNISRINKGYAEYKKLTESGETISEVKPEFHLSKNGQNVVVIMLDRAMNAYIKPILDECPELYDDFTGFTLYENTVSYNGHTLFAAPPLYGGYEYSPEEREKRTDATLKQQHNEALLLMPRVFTEQAGFSATIADLSWANWSWTPDMQITDGYPAITGKSVLKKYNSVWERRHPEFSARKEDLDTVLERDFLWVSIFRACPLALRPLVYYDATWWNRDAPDKTAAYPSDFPELDFLPELTDFTDKGKGTFICFANELTHDEFEFRPPYYELPADKETPKGTSPYSGDEDYSCNATAIHAIARWLRYLKQNGVYDNTRIILASDHGSGNIDNSISYKAFDNPVLEVNPDNFQLKDYYHPLLLCKDFNAKGKLDVNRDFMCNADVPLMAFKDIIKHPVNPFTNQDIADKIKKDDGVKILTSFIWNVDQITDMHKIPAKDGHWFTVKQHLSEPENWPPYK